MSYLSDAVESLRRDPVFLAEGAILDLVDHIAERIEVAGLTRKEVAERAGLTEDGMARFLAGDQNSTVLTLVRILDAIGEDLVLAARPRSERFPP